MGKLLCEKNLRDVWCRNEGVRAEIGQILHTHTHTRLSYSSIDYVKRRISTLVASLAIAGWRRPQTHTCAAVASISYFDPIYSVYIYYMQHKGVYTDVHVHLLQIVDVCKQLVIKQRYRQLYLTLKVLY